MYDPQQHQQQQQYDGQGYPGEEQYYGEDQQHYGGGSGDMGGGGGGFGGGGGDGQSLATGGDYTESIPDISLLHHYCANAVPPADSSPQAKELADLSWGPVREWMRTHEADEVRAAAEQRDDAAKTALHFACQNRPPLDVIDVFLSIALDIAKWPDSFGWLPIHYACAYGADTEVIKNLAEAFPESKTTIDRKGRTPLHFALGTANSNSAAVVVLLSSTGAASYVDDNGMLPLHYACAYGASEESLYVLTDAYHDAISAVDKKGRTPLHFALSNAGRKAAPAAVRHLLSLKRDLVNAKAGGPLPLRVLSEFATTVRDDATQRDPVQRCMEQLLGAKPDPTADFFTALQSLPSYLQERAVVMPGVQVLLNDKISERFPTLILMLDFYAQVNVIVFFFLAVTQSVELRWDEYTPDSKADHWRVIPLYVGCAYFLLREVIQILSLVSLQSFHIWYYEPNNWLNVLYISLISFWTVEMTLGLGDKFFFRSGAALTYIVIWAKFLAYLRNMLIDFAVFSGGVFYVVRRLAAFLLALSIILLAFSRMFFTIFQKTDYCLNAPNILMSDQEFLANLQCEDNQVRPWCDNYDSFVAVYTMMLGEVREDAFEQDKFARAMFGVFMFLVVILLANVLIAIVTDSYKVIQDQRAAIVFWTNRLDYIALMDAIANGPWKTRVKRAFGIDPDAEHVTPYFFHLPSSFGKEFWKRLKDLFEDDIEESIMSFEFLCYSVLRALTAIFIMPFWFVVGMITCGWLWPPQIREAVFTSAVFKHASDALLEDELRKKQVEKLKVEVELLKDDLLQELAINRTNVVQMKSLVAERKMEIQNEMKHIKRVVAMLFEQQSSM